MDSVARRRLHPRQAAFASYRSQRDLFANSLTAEDAAERVCSRTPQEWARANAVINHRIVFPPLLLQTPFAIRAILSSGNAIQARALEASTMLWEMISRELMGEKAVNST